MRLVIQFVALLIALWPLTACREPSSGASSPVRITEVAHHRERLADGTYILADHRELVVVVAVKPELRWQSAGQVVEVLERTALSDGLRLRLRLPHAAQGLEGIDRSTGELRYRLSVVEQRLAPVLARALALRDTGEFQKARALLEGAPELASADEVRKTWLLARCAYGLGEYEKARALFHASAQAAAARGLSSLAVDASVAIAHIDIELHHAPDRAEPPLSFAERHVGGDIERAIEITFYRGLSAQKRGDLRLAVRQLSEVQKVATRLQLSLLRYVVDVRIRLLQALGRHHEALAEWRTRLSEFTESSACEACGAHADVGYGALVAAANEEQPRTRAALVQEAEVHLHRAAELSQSCGQEVRKVNAQINLALLALTRQDVAGAERALARAEQVKREDAYSAAWKLEIGGRVALFRGRYSEAIGEFTRELELAQAAGDHESLWRALVGLGRSSRGAGELTAAAAAFAEAEQALDRLAWGVPLGVGRGLYLDQRQASSEGLVAVLLEEGRITEAHDAARRALAREEALASAGDLATRLSDAQRARVNELLARYRSATEALTRQAANDWALSNEELRGVRRARAEAFAESTRVLDEALSIAVRRGGHTPLEKPKAGTLFLTFLPQASDLVAFAQSDQSARSARLPLDDRSGAALLAPFGDEIKRAARIELRTAGALRDIDLHALTLEGRPLFAYAPVAYALEGERAKQPASGPALVVADPTDALPHARAEGSVVADALSTLGSVTLLAGAGASRDAVLSTLAGASFLHFAGHGRVEPGEALAQRLELAGGSLSLTDVLALPRAPERVVLSACAAGRAGEESALARVLGLAQAFVARGAAQVVAPVRPIDDRASAPVIAKLYEAYQKQPDLVSALRAAQLAFASDPDSPAHAFRVWVQ